MGIVSTIGTQVSLFAMTSLSVCRLYVVCDKKRIHGKVTNFRRTQIAVWILVLITASIAIAIIPIVDKFREYFVNGVKFADELRIFIGTVDKKKLRAILEAYLGRMKDTDLSWTTMIEMVRETFSHDLNYEDYSSDQSMKMLGFYGNDGVCLFKYFVKPHDPQKQYVWSTIAMNFVCFLSIAACYILIGLLSGRASRKASVYSTRANTTRYNRMNRRIAVIITSDFVCWIPFIVICLLHSLEVIDATPYYSLLSIIILPINSFVNPLILDDTIITAIREPLSRVADLLLNYTTRWRIRNSRVSFNHIGTNITNIEMREFPCSESGRDNLSGCQTSTL
jgi:hypothetical protein